MSTKFKTAFNRPASAGLRFRSASLVQPQFQKQADINYMIQRALGGDPSVLARSLPFMADVSDVPDNFGDAMNIMARGETAWNDLPDSIRHTYGNKEAFLDALNRALNRAIVKDGVKDEPKKDGSSAVVVDKKDGVTPKAVEDPTPKSA